MDWFFDKFGRDRVIMDWFKRYKNAGGYPKLYESILSRQAHSYGALNDLIIGAFEAGVAFSRASKRDARPCEARDGVFDKK